MRLGIFKTPLYFFGVALFSAHFLSACSILVGNIKPVEGKGKGHQWMNLAKEQEGWTSVDPDTLRETPGTPEEENDELEDVPDAVFQHKKTGAFISVNSSCSHDLSENPELDLDAYTTALFPGLSNVKERVTDRAILDGAIALKTLIEGQLVDETSNSRKPQVQNVKIETYVAASGTCLYDLIYVARAQYFEKHRADFSKFVKSFRLPPSK